MIRIADRRVAVTTREQVKRDGASQAAQPSDERESNWLLAHPTTLLASGLFMGVVLGWLCKR